MISGLRAQEAAAGAAPKIETNAVAEASADPAAVTADQEKTRREEAGFKATEALSQGDKLLKAGELDKALAQYQFAVKTLKSDTPAFRSAMLGISTIKMKQAEEALGTNDIAKAKSLMAEARQASPNNRELESWISKLNARIATWEDKRKDVESTENNPAVTAEFKDKVVKVQKLFYEGDRLKETGQFDAARKRYEQVLALDPYNKSARERLEKLQKYQLHAAKEAHETARMEAMNAVTERWSEGVIAETSSSKSVADLGGTISNVARINKKLQDIIIKDISFTEAPIEDVVAFLSAKSREQDPTGEGINFVLEQGSGASISLAGAKPGAAASKATAIPPVTITLSNLPLSEVLRFITNITNLKFQVDDYAVLILPTTKSSEILLTRTYSVPAGFLNVANQKGGAVDVKKALQDKGVTFDSDATKAVYLSSTSKMVVKNTQDQLDVIDALIQSIGSKEEPQIEIEAKVAEFTDEALKELSFNYIVEVDSRGLTPLRSLGPFPANAITGGRFAAGSSLRDGRNQVDARFPTAANAQYGGLSQASLDSLLSSFPITGASTGVIFPQTPNQMSLGLMLNGDGVSMLMRALDQMKGVDLLIAPKVVTRNRTQAKIESIREMRYPSAFDAPTVSTTATAFNNTLVNVPLPATPSEFKTENIGVTLNVTPTTFPDQRIDLKLEPEVKDFEGFINYGVQIRSGDTGSSAISVLAEGTVNQPVFNVRKLTTELTVMNGQTVVMGGLIREDRQQVNDKVPFFGDIPVVGRLFRSKIDKSVKKNLMLFVTARLVNSKGRPFYEMQEDKVEVVRTP